MAIKSTIFKASLQIADIDHGYYADHALTLARHPSETDERMMVRLVALALQAHELNDTCGGDGTLAFGVRSQMWGMDVLTGTALSVGQDGGSNTSAYLTVGKRF